MAATKAQEMTQDGTLAVLVGALETAKLEATRLAEQGHKEAAAAQAEAEAARQRMETLERERDYWREETQRSQVVQGQLVAQCTATNAELEEANRRSRELREKLLEMQHDLFAEDFPTLILRLAMNLTGTEQGISTDASGQRVMADVGTADMINVPLHALFEFTKEAAQTNAPVVRNDGFNLPDGSQLVNLAAVPVAVRGELTGVIMVANKRSGPFTEEDTDMLIAVGRHAGVALENRRLHLALEEACRSTIAVLADAIEAKDPYTRGHCEGVASLAVRVAKRLGLTREEMDDVRYAALLHDVGKIGVSDGILLKPGRLLPEEFQVIQRHSEIGSDLISRVPALSHIAPYIRHHHERMDGKGYPAALAGEQIPIAARIISVVDAFDAMTSPRPYRDAIDRDHAVIELKRCSGDQFDPQVVEACLAVLDEEGASVPSEVRPLTPEDGSVGIEVIRQGAPTRASSAGVP